MVAQAPTGEQILSADSVTESLRQLILSGELGIGVQLKQQALAERFGVSRIPVREALKRLEAEGLIEHRAHAGSTVASQSIKDLVEALDIRIALETRALKLAIPHLRPAHHRAAREIIARYDGSDSPQEWADLNLEFHLTLYRPCGRDKLLKMIEESVRGIARHLRALQSHKVGRKSSQSEHSQILKACIAKNIPLAVELLEKHIEHTQAALQE
jgi:DNA-binding GntR family transcriptional regulator